MNNTSFPYKVIVKQNVIRKPYQTIPFKTKAALESYLFKASARITFVEAQIQHFDKEKKRWEVIGEAKLRRHEDKEEHAYLDLNKQKLTQTENSEDA